MKLLFFILCLFVLRTAAQVCDYKNSVELVNKSYKGVLYKDGEYFVDNKTNVERGCVCMKETCIRKCCPIGQGFDLVEMKCVDIKEVFYPPLLKESNDPVSVHMLYDKMDCFHKNEVQIMDDSYKYHVEKDGNLYAINKNNKYIVGLNKYCVDNFLSYNSKYKNKTITFNSVIVCHTAIPFSKTGMIVDVVFIVISCIFMLLTVAVYAFLPELRTLHGMVLTANLLCFFVAFLGRAAMKMLVIVETISLLKCIILLVIIYYSVLAGFLWLNVMSYDLCIKLSKTNLTHGFKQSKGFRFLMYSIYAFGIPIIMTTVLVMIELSDLPPHMDHVFTPHIFLHARCLLKGWSNVIYLDIPIVVTLIGNLTLFIRTTRTIAKTQRETQILNKENNQRLSLFAKLLFMTGITWILDIIETFQTDFPCIGVLGTSNYFIGPVIFYIFVCKKNILVAIKNRILHIRSEPSSTQQSI